MSIVIKQGDCLDIMQQMIAEGIQVDCCVTSPPYWGLRDYGIDGQIGLEATLGEHLEKMVEVFGLVKQILKPEGTLWLNYGDCYATTPNGKSAAAYKADGSDNRTFRDKPFSTIGPINRGKDIPRGSGRWGGGNLPAGPIFLSDAEETDRRGKSGNKGNGDGSKGRIHAGGYLKPKDLCMIANRLAIALQDDGWFVRSEIVWHKPNAMPESTKDRPTCAHEKIWLLSKSAKYYYDYESVKEPMATASISRLSQDVENQQGSARANGGQKTNGAMKAVGTLKQDGHGRRHDGFNERYFGKGNAKTFRGGSYTESKQFDNNAEIERDSHGNKPNLTGDRNLRNVWTIATAAFSEAHFATFPPELAERCIKAGCPKGGLVFDPFGGAGTTGLVADRLQRDAVLIELNPAYTQIAKNRITDDGPMFAEVSA